MLTPENAAAGYEALFDPLTRAAHRARLEHAAVTQPDGLAHPARLHCLRAILWRRGGALRRILRLFWLGLGQEGELACWRGEGEELHVQNQSESGMLLPEETDGAIQG